MGMKKSILFLLLVNLASIGFGQHNTSDSTNQVIVNKDPRIDILGKKMAEYNESLASKMHSTRGYRLMLLSTNDRAKALQVRSQLLQYFPDQEVYMVFQSPFIKIKFGNFLERSEADDYRKQIVATDIIKGNIYIVPEMVEATAERINQSQE
jgi:SPOR domain